MVLQLKLHRRGVLSYSGGRLALGDATDQLLNLLIVTYDGSRSEGPEEGHQSNPARVVETFQKKVRIEKFLNHDFRFLAWSMFSRFPTSEIARIDSEQCGQSLSRQT